MDFEQTILIVDDEKIGRKVLNDLLKGEAKIVLAKNGEQCLEKARDCQPDLILLDIILPDIDGFQVLERLKQSPATQHIPVIFITALNNYADECKGFSLGARDYIQKPFHPDIVNARVLTHLRLKEHVEKNQRQEKALQASELANELKDQCLSIISHELRTPMNGVFGALHLLDDEVTTEDAKKYLASAHCSAQDMMNLVDSMLYFFELQSDKLVLDKRPFRLQQLLTDVESRLMQCAAHKQLSASVTSNLPVNRVYRADSQRISVILHNLLDNAVKFTQTGTVKLLVDEQTTTGSDPDVVLEFKITDSGIGISAEQFPKIFEAFTQTDAFFSRRFEGMGIGLAVCKRLVDLMNGKISVDSTPDQGSCFTVSIPMSRVSVSDFNDSPSSEVTPDLARVLTKDSRVLIVEDNPVNLMMLQGMVKRLGVSVETVQDGAAAVEFFQNNPVDLILMDCQMPVMSGFEATRHIRACSAKGENVPIIAVTANAMSGDRERCFASGMNDYLKKPVRKEDIAQCIRHWLPLPERKTSN
ncbi:histidine kinase [Oleiphilus messinensis]|uniref:histidine kinase n=1 Tax=Oleiphilus messinensis TaxID=141451 RepID=A0A1Y0IBS3_9GAMM|nr:response regulator [Oleiphilus messinensis]ARU56844.1 histidine kinase [Oleiphilus messinensis]